MNISLAVPERVDVSYADTLLSVKGPKGVITRSFPIGPVKLAAEGRQVTLSTDSPSRKDKAILFTWKAHLNNMFRGVQKGWEARMKIIYQHFPLKFSVEGNTIKISNFLGERYLKTTTIIPGVTVKVDKDIVIITGIDIEAVGNQCNNIEKITTVKGRDRRIFADGVWLFQNPQLQEGN